MNQALQLLLFPRMPLKPLAALCRRVSTALLAGIDIRRVWTREAEKAHGFAARRHLAAIRRAVDGGESVAEGLRFTGNYFPPLFREMVEVGEQSGHLGEIFGQLAQQYDVQVELRRTFLGSIVWPMLQLSTAVTAIGFLIWIMGYIGKQTDTPIDILGWGLIGDRGLAIYAAAVATIAAAVWVFLRAARRGLLWTRPIQRLIVRIPVLGSVVRTLALSRLAWSMYQTMNAGVEVRRALRLSLQSTHSAFCTDQIAPIDAAIARGDSIYDAFYQAGNFPNDFLDALQVGEQSGQLVESMEHLSRQYQDQARAAMATLTMLAGFAVWAAVATLIIILIFRLFSFYVGTIRSFS